MVRHLMRPPSQRVLQEAVAEAFMLLSCVLILGSLVAILAQVMAKGLPSLSLAMLTQCPKGGYYLGKEGGLLNALVGSLLLAGGGTALAVAVGVPLALYFAAYARAGRWAWAVRLCLDVLWGIPSIVYGAFGFWLMLLLGLKASLLAGILVLALLELPIVTRAVDEVARQTPGLLVEATLSLGTTRAELASVVARQVFPAVVTASLLAFGRGIGDAASVLFTAGYTDALPTSLSRPAASLPLAVFFQLGTPFPEVQRRAYAAACVLTILVLVISLASRWLAARLNRYVVR